MKATRALNIIAVLLVIGTAASVYQVKYQATWQTVEIERLNRQIAREKAKIRVLDAEWAHLTRPDRIQALAEKNLDLKTPDPRQRITLAALPMRPPKVDSIADTIASLGGDLPAITEPKENPGDDPIGRTIESMGLALPSPDDRIERTMQELGIPGPAPDFGGVMR